MRSKAEYVKLALSMHQQALSTEQSDEGQTVSILMQSLRTTENTQFEFATLLHGRTEMRVPKPRVLPFIRSTFRHAITWSNWFPTWSAAAAVVRVSVIPLITTSIMPRHYHQTYTIMKQVMQISGFMQKFPGPINSKSQGFPGLNALLSRSFDRQSSQILQFCNGVRNA